LHPFVGAFLERLHGAWAVARARLLKQALLTKRRQDIKHDAGLKFRVGDRVLVLKAARFEGKAVTKWHEPTHGPYRIAAVLPHDNYRLLDLRSRRLHDVFHISRLSPFPTNTNDGDGPLATDEFYVSRVVGRRLLADGDAATIGGYEYKVHWEAFGGTTAHDEWLSLESLSGALDCVMAYNLAHPIPGFVDLEVESVLPDGFVTAFPHHSNWRSRRSHPEHPDESPAAGEPEAVDPVAVAADDAEPADPSDADIAPSSEGVDDQVWVCSSCGLRNVSGTHCSACTFSRAAFGVDPPSAGRASRFANSRSTTTFLSDTDLRRCYPRPFRHPHGPLAYRIVPSPSHAPSSSNAPLETVTEFQLSRMPTGSSVRQWVWVYPGPTGQNLTVDENNRVRAYRFDHPAAHPTAVSSMPLPL